ncbi:MAG: hypothetical protein P8P74_06250 [Crocinitomicaceae bacterium]|nr:hypothetical protein [Crocinitomicaceae bacterium]
MDQGVRSIEVNVENLTEGNFTIQSPSLMGSSTWIKNLETRQGEILNQYQSRVIGAMTSQYNEDVSGTFVLTGVGSPFSVEFTCPANGHATCISAGNSEVDCVIHEINSGQNNHVQFTLALNQKN